MARPSFAVAVVGNPKRTSRTGALADCVLQASGAQEQRFYELADPEILEGLMSGTVTGLLGDAVADVGRADVVVVASPTYKAAYTGLLKCFLDVLPPLFLEGKRVIPLMVGASEAHRLAVEFTLKPLIGELGGEVPPRGLYLLESVVAGDPPAVAMEVRTVLQDFTHAYLERRPL